MKINDIRKTDIGIMKYVVGQTFESHGNVYNILSEKYSYGDDTQINAEITIKDGDD
ncbi:hypothetical protein [Levilactobacillus senmaizukei]|uniref:hypothetical protein n=1 Tax=Levilactobacillus senmaizukei TaxID=431273 RepID=UPI000A4D4A49|nr:hypothetical protein [Levilactobacillus senmaizukei]